MTTLKERKALYKVTFVDSEVINYDTKRFRFALPSPDHILGHSVGQNIHIIVRTGNQFLVRHYDITSPVENKGYFDIIVKIYYKSDEFPNGGKMSQYLDSMVRGATVEIKGPGGPLVYEGKGLFSIKVGKQMPKMPFVASKVGLIAGGSGIASMLLMLRTIFNDSEDKTQVNFLYSNKTDKDILLKDELDSMVQSRPDQFRIWYTLTRSAPAGWKYSTGHLTTEMIRDHLPAPGDNVLIVVCGPDAMIEKCCLPSLEALGHAKQNIVVCE